MLMKNKNIIMKDFIEFFDSDIKSYDHDAIKPIGLESRFSDNRKLSKYEKRLFKVFFLKIRE